MTPTITAFDRSPDRGRGLARDMRVRRALEEVGQPYDVRPTSFDAMKQPAHRGLQPFGQIPTYEDGELALFESGAIVLHVAERHAGLLEEHPNVCACIARGEVRPAYVRRPVGGVPGGVCGGLNHGAPRSASRLHVRAATRRRVIGRG